MVQTLETHLVAAYIVSRRVTFAGAPVTLAKLAQMWSLPIEVGQPFLGAEVLARVAKYLRMTVPDLRAAVRNMPLPELAPALEVATIEVADRPVTVTLQAPAVAAPIPEPTQIIPRAQLDELREASRSATPDAPKRDPEPEILISFDEVDPAPTELAATPIAPTSSTRKPRSRGKKKPR